MAGASVKKHPVGVFSEQPDCRGGTNSRHPVNQAVFFKMTEYFKVYRHYKIARMAELVDALVSNTSGSNAVPVRSRLRVLKKSESESESESNGTHSRFFFLTPALTLTRL